jgi:trans-aconitate methyltransferase
MGASGDRDWNARVYARVSEPQLAWGKQVLERLPLQGDETVVDAGCGAGRVTELLAERLPRGHVVALDSSAAMIEQARARLSRFGDRVSFLQADAGAHVVAPPVDAIFSTATFHWVKDHDALFASLAESLRPGGLLVAQWGGSRNIAKLRDRGERLRTSPAFAGFFVGWEAPWYYATPEETQARLERAGFSGARVWLEPAPVCFDDAPSYREFVATVCLRDYLYRLPDDAARARFLEPIVEAAAADTPPFELDYWRLNADARKSAVSGEGPRNTK